MKMMVVKLVEMMMVIVMAAKKRSFPPYRQPTVSVLKMVLVIMNMTVTAILLAFIKIVEQFRTNLSEDFVSMVT